MKIKEELQIKRFELTLEQVLTIDPLFELNAKAEKPGLVMAQMFGVGDGEMVFASCVYFPHETAKKIKQIFDDYARAVSEKCPFKKGGKDL